jgi:hypothetical protein
MDGPGHVGFDSERERIHLMAMKPAAKVGSSMGKKVLKNVDVKVSGTSADNFMAKHNSASIKRSMSTTAIRCGQFISLTVGCCCMSLAPGAWFPWVFGAGAAERVGDSRTLPG